jgi:hypothetical protein
MNYHEISDHARLRFEERYPDLNINEQLERAIFRLGKNKRKQVKERCQKNQQYCTKADNGRYMRQTREGIVFVFSSKDQIVITVF